MPGTTAQSPENFDEQRRRLSAEDWEAMYLAHARGERSDLLPFPDADIQRLTNSAAGEDTARDAVQILRAIFSLAGRLREFHPSSRVLDFGCGWGRLTRLLPYYFDCAGIKGVDVDARLIDSANTLLPFIEHLRIDSLQPVPLADRQFDLVFANSVFSHLSAESHRHAVGEIARLLKPDGVAVLSVLDRDAVARFYRSDEQRRWFEGTLGTEAQLDAALARKGFHWGNTGRWKEYGLAVVTEGWIESAWREAGLQFCGSLRGEHQRSQLFCAARKVDSDRAGDPC